jgi:hypothetical protein
MDAETRQELEDEYYNENRKILSREIKAYILNKNKKYKSPRRYAQHSSFLPLEDIVEYGIDMCDDALFYCMQSADFAIDDIYYVDEKRDKNKAIKSLKLLFQDFVITDDGKNFTSSTKFNFNFITDNSHLNISH